MKQANDKKKPANPLRVSVLLLSQRIGRDFLRTPMQIEK